MPRISQKSLRAVTLRQAQEMTGRIWARHRSTVPDPAAFQSDITRHALGRSHLSLVVCQSPIAVDADGCQDRAFLYLPISGQLQLSIGSNRLSAGPDDVAIVSPRTPHRLEATPVRCIVIEIPMDRLASELSAKGFSETDVLRRHGKRTAPKPPARRCWPAFSSPNSPTTPGLHLPNATCSGWRRFFSTASPAVSPVRTRIGLQTSS